MNKIVVVAHGNFPEGIMSAANLIMGEMPYISFINAFTDSSFDITATAKKCIDSLQEGDKLIVITDMLGSSVNNEFMKYIGKEGYYLVTGLNLPLLLELAGGIDDDDMEAMIRAAVASAGGTINYCNDALQSFRNRKSVADSAIVAGATYSGEDKDI